MTLTIWRIDQDGKETEERYENLREIDGCPSDSIITLTKENGRMFDIERIEPNEHFTIEA